MFNKLIQSTRQYERLKNDIKNGIRHAYIFEGTEGIGKKTAAKWFSAAICCENKNLCGVCSSCKKFEANFHPDFFMTDDEKKSVDDIRLIRDEVFIKPYMSDKKIFVIDGADKLSDKAQNALLKILEEPPEYCILILLVQNTQNLLPTIISRSAVISFEPIKKSAVKIYVEENFPNLKEQSEFISSFSQGIIGKAIRMCEDSSFFEKRKKIYDGILLLLDSKKKIFNVLNALMPTNSITDEDRENIFELLLSWFGDILAIKNSLSVKNTDYKDELDKFASKMTNVSVVYTIDIIAETGRNINQSMKNDLWLSEMLISCWEEIHGTSNRSKIQTNGQDILF